MNEEGKEYEQLKRFYTSSICDLIVGCEKLSTLQFLEPFIRAYIENNKE